MKKLLYPLIFSFALFSVKLLSQSLVYSDGNSGFCSGSGCLPQPNYGVSANNLTGAIFLLKYEYMSFNGNYYNKLIKYPGAASRVGEVLLRNGTYKSVQAESGTATNLGVFIFLKVGDSVIVERYNQTTLIKDFSTGIYTGVGSTEAVDMILAHNCLYIASNDINGLHIRRLNKTTGAIISSVDYNTPFAAYEHALDMEATSNAIVLAGYLTNSVNMYGDEFWTIKFTVGLNYNWQKRYNNNLNNTNNTDRAARIHVYFDSIYVVGTCTRPTGDVDAIIWKYTNTGINRWFKIMNKGWNDEAVDCAIDPTNDDVYMLHKATTGYTTQINATAGNSIVTIPGGINNISIGDEIYCPSIYGISSTSMPFVIGITSGTSIQVFPSPAITASAFADFNPASVSYVTRYNSSGTFQWIKGYKSTETHPGFLPQSNQSYSIFADPNPGGAGCEIYVAGQQFDYGSDPHGQGYGYNYVAYKYNRSGVFFSLINNNVASTGLAPKVSMKQGAYFPNYTGGPKLVLLGDGEWSNPSPGYNGWNMFVYDISSVARFASDTPETRNDLSDKIMIMPNPASEYFTVKSNSIINTLKIYTGTGKLFLETNPNSSLVNISVEQFRKGNYLVECISENNVKYSKLMIH